MSSEENTVKYLCELAAGSNELRVHQKLPLLPKFMQKGMSKDDIVFWLKSLIDLAPADEYQYDVNDEFHDVNSQVLKAEFQDSTRFLHMKAAGAATAERAKDLQEILCEHIYAVPKLRDRNCLVPSPIDTCVITSLLNIICDLFHFPYGSFATNSCDSLSSVLYDYKVHVLNDSGGRSECMFLWAPFPNLKKKAFDSYFKNDSEDCGDRKQKIKNSTNNGDSKSHSIDEAEAERILKEQLQQVKECAFRLNSRSISFDSLSEALNYLIAPDASDVEGLSKSKSLYYVLGIIVTEDGLDPRNIIQMSQQFSKLEKMDVPIHLYITDEAFRNFLAQQQQTKPISLSFHPNVRSISIEPGLLYTSFALFRDAWLRDYHISVPERWPTVYLSQCEAGSSNLRLLLEDTIFLLMGANSLKEMAKTLPTAAQHNLRKLSPFSFRFDGPHERFVRGSMARKEVNSWVEEQLKLMHADEDKARDFLTNDVFHMVTEFVGGQGKRLCGFLTCGGSRSITRALECLFIDHRKDPNNPNNRRRKKLICGNPHFAIERNESKLDMVTIRLEKDGIIDVSRMLQYLEDPDVIAVFVQALSWTDGVSDPVKEVFEEVEKENLKRQAKGIRLITLVCDCCLALSALIHNPNTLRVLDFEGITPRLVTNDPHKHIGVDVGFSLVIGTEGTLDADDIILGTTCKGAVEVGNPPKTGDILRAAADMRLMGASNYVKLYKEVASEVSKVVEKIVGEGGMCVVNQQNRIEGSTVFTVNDPFFAVTYLLTHSFNHHIYQCFNVSPSVRCAFQFSASAKFLKPAAAAEQKGPKIKQFACDILKANSISKSCFYRFARSVFKDDSILPCLLFGGMENCILTFLPGEVFGHKVAALLVKRHLTARMDRPAKISRSAYVMLFLVLFVICVFFFLFVF